MHRLYYRFSLRSSQFHDSVRTWHAWQECWSLLSSRNNSALVGLEDERGTETLTEILSGTLQVGCAHHPS